MDAGTFSQPLPRVPKRPAMKTRPASVVPSKRPRTDDEGSDEIARLVEKVVNSYSAPAYFDLPPEIIPKDLPVRTAFSNNPNSSRGKIRSLNIFFLYIIPPGYPPNWTYDTPATNSGGIHGTFFPGERNTSDSGCQDRVPETATESGLFPGQGTSSGIPEETPSPSSGKESVSGSQEGMGPQDPSASAGPSSSSRPTHVPKIPIKSLGDFLLGDPLEALVKLIPADGFKGKGKISPRQFVDVVVHTVIEVNTQLSSLSFLSLLPSY
jgi:hypothetical protein